MDAEKLLASITSFFHDYIEPNPLTWVVGSIVVVLTVLWIRKQLRFLGGVPSGKTKRSKKDKINRYLRRKDYRTAGEISYSSGDLKKALEFYMKGEHWDEAASVHFELGEWAEAAKLWEEGDLFERAAKAWIQAGELAQAEEVYKKAGKQLPIAEMYEDAEEYTKAAAYYEELGFLKEASSAWAMAEEFSKAGHNLEQYMMESGYFLQAERLTTLPQDQAQLMEECVGYYLKCQKDLKAAEILRKSKFYLTAAEIYLKLDMLDEAAEMLLIGGESLRAADLYEQLGEQKRASELRAQVHMDKGEIEEAARFSEEAGRFFEAADLLAHQGNSQRAAELYEKGEDFFRAAEMWKEVGDFGKAGTLFERIEEYQSAAECFKKAGDEEGRVGSLKKAAQMFEEKSEWLEAAKQYQEIPDVEKAMSILKKIPPSAEEYEQSMRIQADILYVHGESLQAKEIYQSLFPQRIPSKKDLPSFIRLGELLEQEGNLTEAVQMYHKASLLDPSDQAAKMRLKEIYSGSVSIGSSGLTNIPTGRTSPGISDEEELERLVSSSAGQLFGLDKPRYELFDEVGRGGMGIVYKAKDIVLERDVAFKALAHNLRDNPQAIESFFNEARAIAALSHRNIVGVYDAGEQGGNFFIAMEFIQGKTVKEILNEKGKFEIDTALDIWKQLCRGLSCAHERQIIHRDIKGSNVMITEDQTVKIMDFGLAKIVADTMKYSTINIGTPLFIAPEQILGKNVDRRTDIYSLGVTMFEMITGECPFSEGDLRFHHLQTPAPAPLNLCPSLPLRVNDAILRCLEKEADQRFQTTIEILDEFEKLS